MLTILVSAGLRSIFKLMWPFREFQAIGPDPSRISRIAEGSHSRLLIKKCFDCSERFSMRSSVPYIYTSTSLGETSLWRQLRLTTSPRLRQVGAHCGALR